MDEKSIIEIRETAAREVAEAGTPQALDGVRVKYLGRKGILTGVLRAISSLDAAERGRVGKAANEAKGVLAGLISQRAQELEAASPRKTAASLDVSLPGVGQWIGRKHLISLVTEELKTIFTGMGFSVATGPDVEDVFHNFGALNMPEGHPAREQGDTFFVNGGFVLRTHTSPVQIRVMESTAPPIRMIFPGRVYRKDAWDAVHSPEFHQLECLYVDRGVTFPDLKGTLAYFARRFFGPGTGVRFRAGYFPFTEPSAEVDITCIGCRGGQCPPESGTCRVCGGTGWLEILGAGMVHPAVFRSVGYDADTLTGFAFGVGIDRLTMLKYGIRDIRYFLESDLRFLEQFG
jgi:phenylalanyl-tRNA synthetase alpha chain